MTIERAKSVRIFSGRNLDAEKQAADTFPGV